MSRRLLALVATLVASGPVMSAALAPSALAQEASAPPDASIFLEPTSTTMPPQSWSIAVTGGTASVDVLEVGPIVGSEFFVTVLDQSATVEMTVSLSPGWQLVRAFCGAEEGTLVPPDRLVLDVVPGQSYDCMYEVRPAGTEVNNVGLDVFVDEGDPALEWDIRVTPGRPEFEHIVLGEDVGDRLHLFLFIAIYGPSAVVEMTTTTLPSGWELVRAQCFDNPEPRTEIDTHLSPQSFAFDVVPDRPYGCFLASSLVGAADPTDRPPATVPSTETAPEPHSRTSAGWGLVFAALAGIVATSLLFGVRRSR